MRFLFNSTGDYGHFHPLAVLAGELVASSHEVRFATEARFAAQVEASGFEVVALPDRTPAVGSEEWNARMSELEGQDLLARGTVILGSFWEAAIRALPVLRSVVDQWRPDVIVTEQTAWAGALAARLSALPWSTFHFRPAPPGVLAALMGERVRADLEAMGLKGDPELVGADPYLALVGGPEGWFMPEELGPTMVEPSGIEPPTGSDLWFVSVR